MSIKKFTAATADYFNGASSADATSEEKFQDLIKNNNSILENFVQRFLWQPSTTYSVGAIRQSPSMPEGAQAICAATGVSSDTEPAWTAIGTEVTDNGVLWKIISPALLGYPIGAIYQSKDSTSPSSLFGGTWAAMDAGRVLVSAGTASTGTIYKIDDIDGEEKHLMTINELVNHGHAATADTQGNHAHSAWTDTQSASGKIYGGGNATPAQGGADGVFSLSDTYNFYASGDRHDGHHVVFNYSHGHSVGVSAAGAHSHTITIGKTGGNEKFNLMQPYEVCFRWRRTA